MNDRSVYETEFLQLQPQLKRFTEVVENRFIDIFKDESIELGFPLQVRLKTWESIEDKIFLSKRVKVRKSILEMQDIIGLRVICNYSGLSYESTKICII
jgi:ppGpp synthetase/RelA/SpoT-type nucleotidyltranferase